MHYYKYVYSGTTFKNKKPYAIDLHKVFYCVPAETRTLGPLIKSQLLYQLSYGDMYNYLTAVSDTEKLIFSLVSPQFNMVAPYLGSLAPK